MTTWRTAAGWPQRIRVESAAHVPGARELAAACARAVGLAGSEADAVALATTELAENLHRHARHGELIVGIGEDAGAPELTVTALDRGPGVEHFERCFADGYSTTGTLGTGLGAVMRRAHRFDALSEPGIGTVVRAVFAPPGRNGTRARFDVGAMGFPLEKDSPNGDAYCAVVRESRVSIMLADGLGHGPEAAQASSAALTEFAAIANEFGPADVLGHVNDRLVAGRGSAATIATARVSDFLDGGSVATAGLGNVSALVAEPSGATKRIATQHGTVGVRALSTRSERTNALAAGGLVVLHTDGLTSQWNLEGRAPLLSHDAGTIAAVLWRDHARATDDSLVVVVKALPWTSA